MKKSFIAVFLITVFLFSLVGCGKSTEEPPEEFIIVGDSAEINGDDTSAGIYTPDRVIKDGASGTYKESLYALLIYKSLLDSAGEYGTDVNSVLNMDVLDGTAVVSAGEKAKKDAARKLITIIVTRDMLQSYGAIGDYDGILAAADLAKDDYISNLNNYGKLGITLDDLLVYHSYEPMYRQLFVLMYGPGGEREISHEELEQTMLSRMRRIQYTYLPFYDKDTMDDLSQGKIKELKALSNSYLSRFKSGESFEDIVKENYYLLDGYGLKFTVDNVDIYYSVYEPNLPDELVSKVEKLEDGKADIVNSSFYSAVVLRLPVNGNEDELWSSTVMNEEYFSSYGIEFDDMMDNSFFSFDSSFLENTSGLVTPELVTNILNK